MIQLPQIYKIKISIEGIEPLIWRETEVPADLFLHDFHKVIQTVMGWDNIHLHLFLKNSKTLGLADDETEQSKNFLDYTSVRLNDILKKSGDSIIYIYDLGDNWRHNIVLNKIIDKPEKIYYPICTDGARNCPPEDCGGAHGYMEMLSILNSPGHPDQQNILEWLEEEWDPEEFNSNIINELLLEDDFGCMPIIE
ncbi:plasmid pRiA4b ORF-3 family protein [Marinilabiliaceae bacterium ANBcel2]|nr:plasmid pRiA4b ORF-3 family protein [Marinilabiliaceae bacterium ANBcel2]